MGVVRVTGARKNNSIARVTQDIHTDHTPIRRATDNSNTKNQNLVKQFANSEM